MGASMVDDYQEKLPEDFNMFEIRSRVTEKSPYVLVVLQEIERMNELLSEIRRTLIELALGLQGALNMSPDMEVLMSCLSRARCHRAGERWLTPRSRIWSAGGATSLTASASSRTGPTRSLYPSRYGSRGFSTPTRS